MRVILFSLIVGLLVIVPIFVVSVILRLSYHGFLAFEIIGFLCTVGCAYTIERKL